MVKGMGISNRKLDVIYFILLILTVVGVPFGIWHYDRKVWDENLPKHAKEFTLTGHAHIGWIDEEVRAYDVIPIWTKNFYPKSPVILKVSKGDTVVLKLKSSDVMHGFSLKDFGVFITDGIQPGKVTQVSFKADKAGIFTFSCNAICGDNHQKMQGTLVVEA